MPVFIGSVNSVKTISVKQYEKLARIEDAARKYAYSLKGEWWKSVKLWKDYRTRWEKYAESLGILKYDSVYYKVENGKDYSHGYTFSDALA
jgi:hypothetical protein